jgi:hypothetical protein
LGDKIKGNFPEISRVITESSFVKSLKQMSEEANSRAGTADDDGGERELIELAKSFGLNLEEIVKEEKPSKPLKADVLNRVRSISSTMKKQANIPETSESQSNQSEPITIPTETSDIKPEVLRRAQKISEALKKK